VTSHHIIPHSTLVATLGQLTAPQKDGVLRRFLPSFDGLTLETLVNAAITDNAGEPLRITYRGATKTQYHINNDNPAGFQAVARKQFSALSLAEQQDIAFDGVSFAAFQTRYGQLRDGTGAAPSEKEVGMLEAFFEWQSGNQFYAAARYEPGTSNDFDSDAKYVLGDESYVGNLARISKTLKESQARTDPLTDQQKLDLIDTFTSLADLGTAGKAIPGLDDSQWFNLDTNEKEALLESLEGYNRVAASGAMGARDNTKKVHKDIVRQGYKKRSKAKGHKENWHAVFIYLKNDGKVPQPAPVTHPLCKEWQIVATSGKYLGIQGTDVKVLVKHGVGVKMDDIWDALDSLFDLRLKQVFSFLT
jgi:hypothetical protein